MTALVFYQAMSAYLFLCLVAAAWLAEIDKNSVAAGTLVLLSAPVFGPCIYLFDRLTGRVPW